MFLHNGMEHLRELLEEVNKSNFVVDPEKIIREFGFTPEKPSFGQKAADFVTSAIGSWKFIVIQSCILSVWVVLNITAFIHHWDPYPFILMNLILSLQAAYTAPVIMMSNNRQSAKDRAIVSTDLIINNINQEQVAIIIKHLIIQYKLLNKIRKMFEIVNDGYGAQSNSGISSDQ